MQHQAMLLDDDLCEQAFSELAQENFVICFLHGVPGYNCARIIKGIGYKKKCPALVGNDISAALRFFLTRGYCNEETASTIPYVRLPRGYTCTKNDNLRATTMHSAWHRPTSSAEELFVAAQSLFPPWLLDARFTKEGLMTSDEIKSLSKARREASWETHILPPEKNFTRQSQLLNARLKAIISPVLQTCAVRVCEYYRHGWTDVKLHDMNICINWQHCNTQLARACRYRTDTNHPSTNRIAPYPPSLGVPTFQGAAPGLPPPPGVPYPQGYTAGGSANIPMHQRGVHPHQGFPPPDQNMRDEWGKPSFMPSHPDYWGQ